MIFADWIYQLQSMGVIEILLPFLLVFVIVFATLQKTKILGDGKKQYNVVVALIMGLLFVVPHLTGDYYNWGFAPDSSPVDIVNRSLPQVSIIMVAIIMMLLLIGVFGNEVEIANMKITGWIVLLAAAAVVLIFGSNAYWWSMPQWLRFLDNPEVQSLVVMVLVFGLIIWFIVKDETKKEADKGFMLDLGKMVKPKK